MNQADLHSVLNPDNAAATPNPSTTTPAFSGASSASDGGVPFTSGVPEVTEEATNLAPAPTATDAGEGGDDSDGGSGETESTDAGPRATAAVAMGALFGGAVVMLNNL